MKTIAPYYGGKCNHIGEQIACIVNKTQHKFYVEPFGGMAAVLMQKKPSFQEVYNDVNQNLTILFRVIRDRCDEFISKVENTPYSRDEWNHCRILLNEKADELETARRVYVVLSMGFLGSLGNKSFSFGGIKYESSPTRTFINNQKRLKQIRDRLKKVIIENRPFEVLMERYNNDQTLFYLDPPYVLSTRKTKKDYTHEMSDQDHHRLIDLCLESKSKIILSGYRNELYEKRLSEWDFQMKPTWSRGSLSNGKNYDSKRVECLWANFDLDFKAYQQLTIF